MKISVAVELKNDYQYTDYSYSYYGDTKHIYTMIGDDGKVYVWKTGSFLSLAVPYTGEDGRHNFEDRKGNPIDYLPINRGDKFIITATVKGESEYKGQPQTELSRVKVVERTFKAKTPEEIEAERVAEEELLRNKQVESLSGDDFMWRMPYKQYKEHYADCETLCGSYECNRSGKTIVVIIREGRLVASGVRGRHYKGFVFAFVYEGKKTQMTFRAISEATALKQLNKSFKGATDVECIKVYNYFSA